LLLIIGLGLFSCKSKKISLNDSVDVDAQEFIDFFQPLKLPLEFSDTIFKHHGSDSLRIGPRTFAQFIPDSVLTKQFGKTNKPKCYPLGKVSDGKKETYLLVKAYGATRKALYIFCFSPDQKFAAAMPLIISDADSKTNMMASMDAKYTISTVRQRKSADGQILYSKEAYVFNDVGNFMLILTESNEAKPKSQLITNPIDTLSRRHKFSGDYVRDSHNLVSIRDGKDNSHIQFFIHFEEAEDDCKGELKGQAKFNTATTAQYKASTDPCEIAFYFVENTVRLKELGGCGNHRGIKCFFEGLFTKKKEAKAKTVKKKSK
jgi:hypothetical protein